MLLKSDLVVALDRNDNILEDGYIVIEDDRIVEMGLQKDLTLAGSSMMSLN